MAKKGYDYGKNAGLLLGSNSYTNTLLSFANTNTKQTKKTNKTTKKTETYNYGKNAALLLGSNSYTNTLLSFANTNTASTNPNSSIVQQYQKLKNATGTTNEEIENYSNPNTTPSTPAEKVEKKAKNKGKGSVFTGERLEVAQKNAEAKLLAAQNIKDKIQMNKDQLELDNKIRKIKFGKVGMVSKGLGLGASVFGEIRRGH